VVGLHARDHSELGESRDVGRGDVLGMLDPEATIARSVHASDVAEDVELEANGTITDGVHDDVQARGIGA